HLAIILLLTIHITAHLHHRDLPSFPTRRSSDLHKADQQPGHAADALVKRGLGGLVAHGAGDGAEHGPIPHGHRHRPGAAADDGADRKSTRLNSSHVSISYAVFCLKKKTNKAVTQ